MKTTRWNNEKNLSKGGETRQKWIISVKSLYMNLGTSQGCFKF